MASRVQKFDARIKDRENLVQLPGKPITKNAVAKRPVLVDMATNRVPVNNIARKPQKQEVIQKPVQTKTNPTKVVSKSSNTASITLKREESSISKHSRKVASQKPEQISYSSKQLMAIVDVDANDKDDPALVTEYVHEIFQYLRSLETQFPIRRNYLVNHRTTPRMRSIVVNWMVDVHINFKSMLETLHLSVSILDRYLQQHVGIGRETLQLVAVTAMLIASKYEEMCIPDVADFEFICDNTYSTAEIRKMELEMLLSLQFNLGRPLSIHFLRRYNKVAKVTSDHHNLAKYLLEIFLLHHELCHLEPSLQAAAACCLSIAILNEISDPCNVWTRTLVHYSSYKYADIRPVIYSLASCLIKMDKTKFTSIREKYSGSNYGKISLNSKLQGPLVRKLADQASVKN